MFQTTNQMGNGITTICNFNYRLYLGIYNNPMIISFISYVWDDHGMIVNI